MELTLKLNLLDLVDAQNQIDQAQKVINSMRPAELTPIQEVEADLWNSIEADAENAASSDKPKLSSSNEALNALRSSSQASKVFSDILNAIGKNGEATLGEIAVAWDVDVKTIRGHLMNGLRTLKHRDMMPPFIAKWNHEKRCVVYTAR